MAIWLIEPYVTLYPLDYPGSLKFPHRQLLASGRHVPADLDGSEAEDTRRAPQYGLISWRSISTMRFAFGVALAPAKNRGWLPRSVIRVPPAFSSADRTASTASGSGRLHEAQNLS